MTTALPVDRLVDGKYEVLRLIGRGGMGSVWEGRHATLRTPVAIKFVEAEHAESEEARARFLTEARAAAALRSRHAIQIFDHGVTGAGRPYIVMELLVGEALDQRIERLGRLPLAEVARIVGQVARGLTQAHAAGIVHRDLKPENIYLARADDDDEEMAKILDFGIAKIKPRIGEEGPSSRTKTGAVLGTPYYMSPEQARGLRSIDHRTDLWSLGVIAYKCAVGVLPFEGESVGDVLVKICTAPLPVPSRVAADLPSCFDAWFVRALGREPSERFATAFELADALSRCAGIALRRPSARDSETSSPSFAGAGALNVDSAPAATVVASVTGEASVPILTQPGTPRAARALWMTLAALIGAAVGVVTVAQIASSSRAWTTRVEGTAASVAARKAASREAFDQREPRDQQESAAADARTAGSDARTAGADARTAGADARAAASASVIPPPAPTLRTPPVRSVHVLPPTLPPPSAHPLKKEPPGLVDPGY